MPETQRDVLRRCINSHRTGHMGDDEFLRQVSEAYGSSYRARVLLNLMKMGVPLSHFNNVYFHREFDRGIKDCPFFRPFDPGYTRGPGMTFVYEPAHEEIIETTGRVIYGKEEEDGDNPRQLPARTPN